MDLKSILFNLIVLYVIFYLGKYISLKFTQNVKTEQLVADLNKKKFKMIGSTNCIFCHRQLSELNLDWNTKILNIIDCANKPEICSQNPAITGFPSWVSGNGKVYSGFKTIPQLKKIVEEN